MTVENFECRSCERNSKRESWGNGPWENEPNRVEFEHAGLPCILHRGGGGAWCGYVGLSPGHPFHGKSYSDDGYEMCSQLSVHGGITYAESCAGHVCHVPKPGEPDDLWWLGFDCSHAWDYRPADSPEWREGTYRDQEWVTAETKRLAEQLAAIK